MRAIMGEESLVARAAKKKRRYSSYQGEISEAPGNLLRDGRGKHHFRADAPNELVSVNIIFTIFTNVFSPIAPTRMRRIRQRGCAAFGA